MAGELPTQITEAEAKATGRFYWGFMFTDLNLATNVVEHFPGIERTGPVEEWPARNYAITFARYFGLPAATEQWIDVAAREVGALSLPTLQEVIRRQSQRPSIFGLGNLLIPLVESAHEVATNGLDASIRHNRRLSRALKELSQGDSRAIPDSKAFYPGPQIPYVPAQTFRFDDVDGINLSLY